MNKNEREIALYHKRKRRRHRIFLCTLTIIFILLGLVLAGIYYILNIKHYMIYTETSNINYSVNLIDNNFYKTNHLEGNVAIIANLIKNIDIEFKYDLNLSEEIEYTYSYKILANISAKEKSKTNLIYSDEKQLLNKRQQTDKSRRLEIVENVTLDYNTYNNEIARLIELYKLDNTTCELSLNMNLEVINKETGERINQKNNVMSIIVPLDEKTVEIVVNENVKDSQGKIEKQENENQYLYQYLSMYVDQMENINYYLIFSIAVTLGLGLLTFISLMRYNKKTRSAERMYDDELKKILFDYKSYIQKITTKMDYNSYQVINVDTFNELIGMREEIQAPILMYTEENDRITTFMMINDKMMFTYVLEADLIRKKLIEEHKKKVGRH